MKMKNRLHRPDVNRPSVRHKYTKHIKKSHYNDTYVLSNT